MTRPTTLTVLGILAIIFGALGVLCTPLQLLNFSNPAFKELLPAMGGPFRIWMITSIGLGIVASLVELTLGIGMLQCREWARKLGLVFCAYKILMSFVGAAVQLLIMKPMMETMMQDLPGGGASAQQAMGIGMAFGAAAGVIGIAVVTVIYGVIAWLLTRPDVVQACTTEPVERAYAGSL